MPGTQERNGTAEIQLETTKVPRRSLFQSALSEPKGSRSRVECDQEEITIACLESGQAGTRGSPSLAPLATVETQISKAQRRRRPTKRCRRHALIYYMTQYSDTERMHLRHKIKL